ncbi:hypothetical protein DY000_02056007 [Brassica cretica]|uniref:AT-hook motif nuclear-localized protein n=1 Tax=Brassica cretica TaxID=69181 RepID=A0ABQ7ANI2_BRACR|nr:hypothetical protein DY000_02056007 [Brassica cretica]
MSAPVLSVLDIRLGRLRRALHEGDGGFSPGFFPALFDLLLLSVQLILGPSSNEIRRLRRCGLWCLHLPLKWSSEFFRRVPVPVCSGGSPIKLPAVAFQSVKVVEALVGTSPSQTHSLGCINVVYDYGKLVGAFVSGIQVKIIQGFLHIELASPTNISILCFSVLFVVHLTVEINSGFIVLPSSIAPVVST